MASITETTNNSTTPPTPSPWPRPGSPRRPETVRAFLDSRHGRHFADEVQNGLFRGHTLADAINAATLQWMGWKIGRQTSKDYGIPRGLPYLTGFVIHCEIVESGTDESLAA